MVYTNTVGVMPDVLKKLPAAMSDEPNVVAVLLTCNDETARLRLGRREIGSTFDEHLAASTDTARQLERAAPVGVSRIATDDRTVGDIATEVIDLTGWWRDPPAS